MTQTKPGTRLSDEHRERLVSLAVVLERSDCERYRKDAEAVRAALALFPSLNREAESGRSEKRHEREVGFVVYRGTGRLPSFSDQGPPGKVSREFVKYPSPATPALSDGSHDEPRKVST